MQIRFKPKFWKDINHVKNDKDIMSVLYRVFRDVQNAEKVDKIDNIKQLEKFEARYRIRLSLDKKEIIE